jgi:hypothetical protein
VTLTNEGDVAVTITGEDFDFSPGRQGEDYLVSSSTCGGSLAVGSTCIVRVRFAPQGTGSSASSLILSGAETASGAQTIPTFVALSGSATGLPQGPAGTDGTDGTSGADGANGPSGADGTNGTNGTNGSSGADGSNGARGATGSAGPPGAVGPAGQRGHLDAVMEIVECHRSKGNGARNVVCYFRATPAKGARLNLSFRRKGVALATGSTKGSGGVQKVTLKAKNRLGSGLYLLTLSYRAGGVQHSTSRSASIR